MSEPMRFAVRHAHGHARGRDERRNGPGIKGLHATGKTRVIRLIERACLSSRIGNV
jgi:hypothetical protein